MPKRALWPAPTGAPVGGEDGSRATDPVRTAADHSPVTSIGTLCALPEAAGPRPMRWAIAIGTLDAAGRVGLGISAPGRVLLGADAS
ncbi:MAG: hypothetical protein M0035_12715 [Actinomycetota bacterium]|nr:hypothetical protein [Actinomycetota bacterium]